VRPRADQRPHLVDRAGVGLPALEFRGTSHRTAIIPLRVDRSSRCKIVQVLT
jgi:hypothetical protein